jgi:hypothetical protein
MVLGGDWLQRQRSTVWAQTGGGGGTLAVVVLRRFVITDVALIEIRR